MVSIDDFAGMTGINDIDSTASLSLYSNSSSYTFQHYSAISSTFGHRPDLSLENMSMPL